MNYTMFDKAVAELEDQASELHEINKQLTPMDTIDLNVQRNLKTEREIREKKPWIESLAEASFAEQGRFICVFSGEQCREDNFVSPRTLEYFKFDVTKLMCHGCQQENRNWEKSIGEQLADQEADIV